MHASSSPEYLHNYYSVKNFSHRLGQEFNAADPEAMLPNIPLLPILAEDALPILASLRGPDSPADLHGALDLPQMQGWMKAWECSTSHSV
jgi:hypothetical protein